MESNKCDIKGCVAFPASSSMWRIPTSNKTDYLKISASNVITIFFNFFSPFLDSKHAQALPATPITTSFQFHWRAEGILGYASQIGKAVVYHLCMENWNQ